MTPESIVVKGTGDGCNGVIVDITWGLSMSFSEMPVAYSMACDAPCDFGCVTLLLYLFRPFGTLPLLDGMLKTSASFSGAEIADILQRCFDKPWPLSTPPTRSTGSEWQYPL